MCRVNYLRFTFYKLFLQIFLNGFFSDLNIYIHGSHINKTNIEEQI